MANKKRQTQPVASQDLLLEIGCEDLPARYVKPLSEALAAGVQDGLHKRGLAFQDHSTFATPRRIAVLIRQLAARQADQVIERLGPALAVAYRDGTPTPAALGFAKSCGVELAALGEKDGKLYFTSTQAGQATQALIPEIFEEALARMDELVPKRMRWGTADETFVRPVQWLLCLYGSKTLPLTRFGLKAGNKTYGHRFHAPKAIALKSPAEYEKKLKAAKVIADFAQRRSLIQQQIDAAAKALRGHARASDSLLDEVTALVEWPVVLSGKMDQRFMALPPEVIVATIEVNQRYFPVFDGKGRLLAHFITVSNIQSRDKTQVVVGNERVVRPRLSDALFFWEQDRKKPVTDFLDALDKVTFQQKLGTVADKSKRIAAISSKIASLLQVEPAQAEQAARLCKADLVTRMVYEFPELQGVMGGYYSEAWGGNEQVAAAVREHYQPTHSGGPIPGSPLGCIIALADKLDSLAGIFAIGQKPSSSKDPYALRRAALGVLRILLEGELDLDLRELLAIAVALQPEVKDAGKTVDELLQFHWDRLRGYYIEAGVAIEVFESVAATGISRPRDVEQRIRAVEGFRKLAEAEKLAAAHKRVRNILRQARERKEPIAAQLDRQLAEASELALLDAMRALQEAQPEIFLAPGQHDDQATSSAKRYLDALKGLASLQAPVDAFFTAVMVMAEDPAVRANRLALLTELDRICRSVADISCLPG